MWLAERAPPAASGVAGHAHSDGGLPARSSTATLRMSQLFIVSPTPRSVASSSVEATYSSSGSHAHSAISEPSSSIS